jgi:hypothetical protein
MRRLLLIALLLVAGCTTTYTKPGLTQSEWDRDTYACEAGSMGVPAGVAVYAPNPGAPGWAGVESQGGALMNASQNLIQRGQQARLYKACMKARGYTPS